MREKFARGAGSRDDRGMCGCFACDVNSSNKDNPVLYKKS